MKKTYLTLFVIFIVSGFAYSQSINMTYTFERPQIITTEDGYSELIFENAANFNSEGNPLIPHFGCKVLLPAGTEISEVRILNVKYSQEIQNIKIKPASREFPISEGAPDGYKVKPNPEIYTSGNAYPSNVILSQTSQFLNGHSIGLITVCPVIYNPSGKTAKILEEITLSISSENTPKAQSSINNLRFSNRIQDRIESVVDNPSDLANYSYPANRSIEENDILLITKNDLTDAFDDYVDFKSATGFIVEIYTVEDIYNDYTGADEPEQIRNCIIDYYQNWGTSYVILAGDSDPNGSDDDIIPHRGFYAEGDYDIPSDMYYSCLDGTWNDDGDNRWGEVGEYDIYSEVVIGRICVDSETEIDNFTNKLKMYQDSPVIEDIEKALMIGEELNNNPWTFGGDYKDQIVEGCSLHGITTAGISDNISVNYLYDRDGGWNRSQLYNEFNNVGINLLNHLGHSNVTYNMKMYNSHVNTSNLQNDGINRGYVIGYSQGCYNGSFDNRTSNNYYTEDCFAEKITTLSTGYVAAIANSRYGWYSPGNTNSSSQFHDRQFFDAIFGEDISEIGYVNSDAQGDNAPYMDNWGLMRWVVYEANLFGDPSMDIWTAMPDDIVATYPPSIPLGIGEISINTGVGNARVGLMQEGSLIGRGISDIFGDVTITFFEPVASTDKIALSIIAHNKNRLKDSIIVINDEPFVLYDDHMYNDEAGGNNNGLVDCGESILLTLDMKNVGNEPASEVDVTVSYGDEYVTITDNTEYYGDFEPEEIKTIPDGFAFDVADSVPDQYGFKFTVEAVGDTTWRSYLTGVINAPVLAFGNIVIDDSVLGNSNGKLDPGEEVTFTVSAMNTGHCASSETFVSLSTENTYISIENEQVNVGSIEAGNASDAVFTLIVDEETPIGTFAEFNMEINDGVYACDMLAEYKVGFIVEDFETGDFEAFEWYSTGNADWEICLDNPFEGTYCAKSGEIDDTDISRLFMAIDVLEKDSVSFYQKVSSEADYDFLKFYIDNTVIDQWSGETEWERVSYIVPKGYKILQWVYKKDLYESGGEDCGWVDYISLPFSNLYYVGTDELSPEQISKNVNVFPNPFNTEATILVNLEEKASLNVEVFNLNGQKVNTLINASSCESGVKKLIWDGTNEAGTQLNPGIYYIRTTTEKKTFVNKVILSR